MMYQIKTVILDLGPEWMIAAEPLMKELQSYGIHIRIPDRTGADPSWREWERILVLTDDPVHAVQLASKGIVCIGCQKKADRYFEGAAFVVESLADLDIRTIEETFCHGMGIPMTIAQTQRLVIREITDEDLEFLERLGHSEGMHLAVEEEEGEGPLDAERLAAYLRYVYRLYGYGLWIAVRSDGEPIGLCGLGDWNEELIDQSCSLLQLQYAVAPPFRGQGYAFEMCRAVMKYAWEHFPERSNLWLRIHTGNTPSLRLAEKLGFRCCRTIGTQKIYRCSFAQQFKKKETRS